MNSNMNNNKINEMWKVLDNNERTVLLSAGYLYGKSLSYEDSAKRQIVYEKSLEVVKQLESRTGIVVFESEDGNYYRALFMLFNRVNDYIKATEERKKKEAEQVFERTFSNVEEANSWLKMNNNIRITHIDYETGSSLGLLANHTTIRKVHINYNQSNVFNNHYGIMEDETTSIIVNQDSEVRMREWRKAHPDLRVINQKAFSCSRGDSFSLAVGFGDYAQNLKLITLFQYVEKNRNADKTMAKEKTLDTKKINFYNQSELNSWLMQHKNIEVKSVKYELINERKLFKSYVTTRGITLDYSECENTNHKYYFVENREKWEPSTDAEVIKNKWKELYPKYVIVDQQVYENDEKDGHFTILTICYRD